MYCIMLCPCPCPSSSLFIFVTVTAHFDSYFKNHLLTLHYSSTHLEMIACLFTIFKVIMYLSLFTVCLQSFEPFCYSSTNIMCLKWSNNAPVCDILFLFFFFFQRNDFLHAYCIRYMALNRHQKMSVIRK